MASDKGFEAFLEALGVRESSGRYDNDKNPYYHGKYQMGLDALHEAKYYDKNKGVFLGKNGRFLILKNFLFILKIDFYYKFYSLENHN